MPSTDPDARPAAAGRVLLVAAPNSYRTFAYIDAARRLGAEILVASPGRHSLVTRMAGGLHVDLDDPGALAVLLAAARAQPFTGVVATDDASVELASTVAAALDLPHNPPAAARLSRRKDLARARLTRAGLPVPAHRCLDLTRDLAPQIRGLGYPCVVKPLALSASRGVIRADDPGQLQAACARIRRLLARETGPADEREQVLVEAYVGGPEVALEGLLHRGELQVLAVFDKPDPLEGPFFEETYYISPARLAPEVLERVCARVAAACTAYGLREGPVHAELRLAGGEAWIMEVAARTIGGHCGRLLRFGTGHSLEELVLVKAMGGSLPVRPDTGGAGVLMIPIPQAGILRRVEGVLAARQVPYVEDLEISVREGYELVPLPEGSSYLGFIFARAPSAAAAEQALREAHGRLRVVVAPLIPVLAG